VEGGELVNFDDVFEEFETPFAVITTAAGHHDWQQGGIWVPGTETETEVTGIIVPLTGEDLRLDAGGTYTRADIKVFYRGELVIGSEIKHGDRRYTVHQEQDFDHHAGFRVYICRRVSADD
jgi:hypothetical protein